MPAINAPKHHMTVANPLFDFSTSLLKSIDCDAIEYASPPPSPDFMPSSAPYHELLDDLSPLTSLGSSPASSPIICAHEPQETIPYDLALLATPLLSPPLSTTPTSIPKWTPPAAKNLSPQSSPSRPCNTNENGKKPLGRKAKQHTAQKAWRQKRRKIEKDAIGSHYKARENAHCKYVRPSTIVECSWDASKATFSKTGFVGGRDGSSVKREFDLEELVGENSKWKFQKVEWDGSTPTAIIDSQKRIVTILAGRPDDKSWLDLQSQAADALEACRGLCRIPKARRKHRRGAFSVLNCGVSHGGGQTAPGNLKNDSPNAEVLEELNGMEPFKRIAGFASAVLATWAPNLHEYYSKVIDTLHSHNPSLKRIFPSSVFSAVTYNMGPRTVCSQHTDRGNLAFGMCSVTPVGKFDPTQGGHLVLWDLHLVIEFPPGSTILLPSAIVKHSNTKVGKHEQRYSFAQYSAGALFQWVDNNCMTGASYLASLSEEELEDDCARSMARWEFGLSLIPTYSPPEEQDDGSVGS